MNPPEAGPSQATNNPQDGQYMYDHYPTQGTLNTAGPIIAQGDDWARSLVQLAKTAELKKHTLALQLHTAHILSTHGELDKRNSTLEDVKAQKNWLESERAALLDQLRLVNEDRDKADLLEGSIQKERTELLNKINTITNGDYDAAKQQVDSLRAELSMTPMRSLQSQLDERSASYLQSRLARQGASGSPGPPYALPYTPSYTPQASTSSSQDLYPNISTAGSPALSKKRGPGRPPKHPRPTDYVPPPKRPRGRPKGSRNKPASSSVPHANDAGEEAGDEGAVTNLTEEVNDHDEGQEEDVHDSE